MSMHTMRAAEVGWSIFRSTNPPPTHDEINEFLKLDDLPPVSVRMYDHYRRLVRHGFSTYVPINELDMHVKAQRRARRGAA